MYGNQKRPFDSKWKLQKRFDYNKKCIGKLKPSLPVPLLYPFTLTFCIVDYKDLHVNKTPRTLEEKEDELKTWKKI
jgi:hypothetical protein